MKNIKYAIVFDFDRKGVLRKDGTSFILIRAYLNGRCKYFSTGINIPPKQWHSKYQKIVHHPNQFELNKAIRDQLSKMEKFEYDIRQREGKVSLDRLADYDQGIQDCTFTEFFENQLLQEKASLSRSSYTDYNQTLDKLKEYRKNIYFGDISVRFVNGFLNWLATKGLGPNTVHKHFKNLRKFINLGIQFNYIDANNNPCRRIKLKKKPVDRLYLTEFELGVLESFEVPAGKPHWQDAKDFFLFSCYTGLRFSDVSSILRENILNTDQGMYLFLTSQKTNKPYEQNLRKLFPRKDKFYSKPEELLKKRMADNLFKDRPLFVYTCRGAYVKQLKAMTKEIRVRERIKKEIASHTGRHTFGTIMAGKIDVHILKELMQHANVRETMHYVHMNQAMINKALDNVDWFDD